MWAVGTSHDGPLIMHWNGVQWSNIPGPRSIEGGTLKGVTAVSINDIWAVGYTNIGTLIIHWDGKNWNVVTSPRPGRESTLVSISASSATNIWAVGYYKEQATGEERTLVLLWNGLTWNVLSSPNLKAEQRLSGVVAKSSEEVWVVGFMADDEDKPYQPLIAYFSQAPCKEFKSPSTSTP